MKTQWFKATIYRIPTAFSQPKGVAIEANNFDHAVDRLYKLFGNSHADYCGGPLKDTLLETPCRDTDDIGLATKFPMPKLL